MRLSSQGSLASNMTDIQRIKIRERLMADHLALFNTLWYLQKALSWLKPTTRSTLQTVRLPGHKIAPVIKVKAFCQVRWWMNGLFRLATTSHVLLSAPIKCSRHLGPD